MAIETMDPREYAIKPSGTSLEETVEHYFPLMRAIGSILGKLNVLPMMEEPADSGHFVTTGNFSLRIPVGGFLITGTNVDKAHLCAQDLLYVEAVHYDSAEYLIAGHAKPSRETLIHDQIYAQRPDVNVILHVHDQMALKYMKTRQTTEPIFFATLEQARSVTRALGNAQYVTLPQHGQFIVGKNIQEALDVAAVYHSEALSRTPVRRMGRAGVVSAMVASFAFVVYASAGTPKSLQDCSRSIDADSITYTCPTARDVDVREWVGEQEIRHVDNTYSYTLYSGPMSP